MIPVTPSESDDFNVAFSGLSGPSLLLGVLVRAAAMLRGPAAFDDPDNYLPLARSVAGRRWFHLERAADGVSAAALSRSSCPVDLDSGQPFVLGIALLHLGLGAGTVWLTAAAAKGSGLSLARSLLAALVTACDPVLVWQSRSVMTETPTAFFLAAALAALTCRGVGGTAAGRSRPGTGCPLPAEHARRRRADSRSPPFLVKPGERRERLIRAGLLGATIIVVLSPWMIRNLMVFGEPILTTTHGGYTLALANNPVYYDDILHGPPGRVWTGHDQWLWWDSVNQATAGMTEPQADRYLKETVWQLIQERPGDFARATLARVGHFWSVAPAASVYSRGVRWATMAWTLPLLARGRCSACRAASSGAGRGSPRHSRRSA